MFIQWSLRKRILDVQTSHQPYHKLALNLTCPFLFSVLQSSAPHESPIVGIQSWLVLIGLYLLLPFFQGLWVKNSRSLSLSFWPYRNRKATSQICCPVEGEIYSTRFHSRYLKDYGQWGFKDGEMSLLPWYEFS